MHNSMMAFVGPTAFKQLLLAFLAAMINCLQKVTQGKQESLSRDS